MSLLLANVTVAMNAFELSKEGKEKTGMDSVTIGSFLDELEKISGAAGTVFKTGITQAIPKLKGVAQSAGKAVSTSAGTVAGRAAKPMAGTVGGVLPKSLGTTARPPSGSLTGTHMRSNAPGGTQIGTQITPRSPGQGSTKIHAPRPPAAGAAQAAPNPAPGRPASAPPPTNKRKGLLGTLALGGGALMLGGVAGHMLPQQQPQQQQMY